MLKLLVLTITLAFSFTTRACWKLDGSFAVDGETVKMNQKVEHDKTYSFPMSSFILSLTFNSKAKEKTVNYLVQEKKGTSLVLITKGTEEVTTNKVNTIFAKGEEGQPNSIITINLRKL